MRSVSSEFSFCIRMERLRFNVKYVKKEGDARRKGRGKGKERGGEG